jgi:hypothetical protein
VNSNHDLKKRLLKKYQAYTGEDNIYKLVHELDRDFLEYEVVLPFINSLFDRLQLIDKINKSRYFNFIKLMWTRFEFKNGTLFGTINNSGNMNSLVRFIIAAVPNEKTLNFSFNKPESVWLTEMLNKTKGNQTVITFNTNQLQLKDPLVKELYTNGGYFSKRLLEILITIRTDLNKRKSLTEENLENILFKK